MLGLPFESPIKFKQLSIRCFDAVASAQRINSGQYAGFPVDEGTVAVEAKNGDVSEIQHRGNTGPNGRRYLGLLNKMAQLGKIALLGQGSYVCGDCLTLFFAQ